MRIGTLPTRTPITDREKVAIATLERDRVIDRERIRACAAAAYDDMVMELIYQITQTSNLKCIGTVARKQLIATVLRAEKDRLKIMEIGEYVRRFKFIDEC